MFLMALGLLGMVGVHYNYWELVYISADTYYIANMLIFVAGVVDAKCIKIIEAINNKGN